MKRTMCSVDGCGQVATAIIGNTHYCRKHDPSNKDVNPFEQKSLQETETYKTGGFLRRAKGGKSNR